MLLHCDSSTDYCCNVEVTVKGYQRESKLGVSSSRGPPTGGVCNSGTWLRHYAPFQDLSAIASCSTVATYGYNIIKTATASGPSMNAMLKAQMLATALDVYSAIPRSGETRSALPFRLAE